MKIALLATAAVALLLIPAVFQTGSGTAQRKPAAAGGAERQDPLPRAATALGRQDAGSEDGMLLRLRLIWGTDDPADSHPKLQTVDQKLARRLGRVFKWDTYLEISGHEIEVWPGQTLTSRVSPKCEVEITHLGDSEIRIDLVGEGQKVMRRTQTVRIGQTMTLAGDDKDDTAWFVVIERQSFDAQRFW